MRRCVVLMAQGGQPPAYPPPGSEDEQAASKVIGLLRPQFKDGVEGDTAVARLAAIRERMRTGGSVLKRENALGACRERSEQLGERKDKKAHVHYCYLCDQFVAGDWQAHRGRAHVCQALAMLWVAMNKLPGKKIPLEVLEAKAAAEPDTESSESDDEQVGGVAAGARGESLKRTRATSGTSDVESRREYQRSRTAAAAAAGSEARRSGGYKRPRAAASASAAAGSEARGFSDDNDGTPKKRRAAVQATAVGTPGAISTSVLPGAPTRTGVVEPNWMTAAVEPGLGRITVFREYYRAYYSQEDIDRRRIRSQQGYVDEVLDSESNTRLYQALLETVSSEGSNSPSLSIGREVERMLRNIS